MSERTCRLPPDNLDNPTQQGDANMTRKVDDTERDNADDLEERLEQLEDAHESDDLADSFLSEFAGQKDIEVKVFAKPKNSRTLEYLFSTDPESHSLGTLYDHLRDTYGGGQYTIHVRDGKGLRKNKTIAIRAPLPGKEPQQDSGREIAEFERRQEERARQQENGLAQAIQAMNESNSRMMQAMQQNTMDMMKLMLQNKPEPSKGMDLSDPNTLMALKTLFTPEEKSDPTEYLMRGIELAQNMGGGKDTNDMDVLLAGIKSIAPGLTAMASRQFALPNPQPAANPHTPPRSSHPPAASEVTGSDRPASDPQAQQVQQGMSQLAQSLMDGASQNVPPEQYVEPIIDMLGPDQAYAVFSTREGRAEIVRLLPSAEQFSDWLDRLGRAIDEATAPEDDASMSSPQGAADVPNAHAADPSVSRESPAGNVGDSPDAADHGEAGTPGEGKPAAS